MKSYVSVYLKYFDYSGFEFIPCETCGAKSVDIAYIEPKGSNPSLKDNILNLMAACRNCHDEHANKKDWLRKKHIDFMMTHQPKKTEALLNSIYSGNEAVR